MPGGQCQPQRMAAAMACGHENGGGFAPQQQFLCGRGRLLFQRGQGHQQAGGATGERGGLLDPGQVLRSRVAALIGGRVAGLIVQPFLVTQGVFVILVIVRRLGKQAVAQAFIQGDGRGVIPAHFQSQEQTPLLVRIVFGGFQ